MAKSGYRSVKSMGNIVKSRMDLMKSWDKKDALALMLPQRVENHILYNFKNDVIGGCDGEDVIFHEDETIITETNRITDKFLSTFYAPMEAYFGEAADEDEPEESEEDETEDDEIETEEDVKPSKKDKKKKSKDVVAANHPELDEIAVYLVDGKIKKAKKVLKGMDEDHADYKEAKKLIKKAKGE